MVLHREILEQKEVHQQMLYLEQLVINLEINMLILQKLMEELVELLILEIPMEVLVLLK
jgi:hypothetical protein